MKNAIELHDLHKEYNKFQAVKSLSLTIDEGEIFGFLGHNGAGKTTTIHMLTTLLRPSSGTASIHGHDICANPLEVRRHIGYVPENVSLYNTLTARKNLLFFAKLSGLNDAASSVEETAEFLGITDLLDRRVGTFSKGMRQRIGLAQAIVHRPRVLFLDEPSSGLDPQGIKMLRELIRRLRDTFGMTIFMNTHLISEIAKTCTSIGVLSHGQLVYQGSVEAVTGKFKDHAALEELFLSVTPDEREGR
ncbi:MAG: ABC transporter ATP-binding protein [Pseudodesulfovibrio sp.]|uniref:ABC transporter ATP-binding protein n=1 Tax=Pseudodesulfovibrio sp. TaxID=2035812 RepID=UPI003D117AF8